jgi:hypothetical protein
VELDKAMYGCIESARMWYEDLAQTLRDAGYVANPADKCVFNLGSGKGQCTAAIHVDDMMISCVNQRTIDSLLTHLRNKYPDGLTLHRGPILSFLGMTFDFSATGEVSVTQAGFVNDLLSSSGVDGTARSPAAENLFQTRDDGPEISEAMKDWFHSFSAKLLYLGKRSKPEILVAAAYLATRVTKANQDDVIKLQRAIKYVRRTKDTGIVLRPADLGICVLCSTDAAYGLYTSDGKSVTGSTISVGRFGPVHAKSTKQSIVAKSSMEAELIALSDSSNQPLHLKNFLEFQGHPQPPAIMYQDNMSAMHLIEKGKSTSEKTRHINIRYFWIKERIDGGEIVVTYMPSAEMTADALKKPLQGSDFETQRRRLTAWST